MTQINRIFTIPPELERVRLDQALSKMLPEYSRSLHQQWIQSGCVQVNQKMICRPRTLIHEGNIVQVNAMLRVFIENQPQDIALNIVHADSDLLIINKPAGLVVHPGAGNPDRTIVNALIHYDPLLAELPRGGLIHRLDKDTSGLLLIARTIESYHRLVQALQKREIKREYEAIVTGVMISGGTIDAPIGRHTRERTKMNVCTSGKFARTHYRVIHRYRAHTHIHIQLETGRTHQIRVHLAHIHYPIIGDTVYGKNIKLSAQLSTALQQALQRFPRQALHASQLTLRHPVREETITCHAPLPPDMQQLLLTLQADQALEGQNI